MSAVAELINQLCPNGVEYKALGEIIDYEQPTRYIVRSTEYDDSYDTPVLTAGQSFVLGYTDEEDNHYPANKSRPVIIFDDFTTASQWVDFEFKVKSSAMKMLKLKPGADSLLRFVFYSMKCIRYTPVEHSRHWIGKYSNFEIPHPPLPIQQEIVRRLDAMTGLFEDLEMELAARQKQYEWVREETFKQLEAEGVERKKLGEVCVIKNGKDYKAFGDGPYPVYGSGGIMTYVDRFSYDKPSVLIPRKGSIENLFYVESPFWNVDTIFYTEVNNQVVVPKYLYYSLQTVDLKRLNNAGGVPSLTQTGLYTLVVPVPPISVQQQIVRRLDVMSELIAGIEKEIAQRKQQYEYCREKLLTFKRAG